MMSLHLFNLPNKTALDPEVYLVSNRNEYQEEKKYSWSTARPARKANLTTIREPIV
jgi:hypothetical protein